MKTVSHVIFNSKFALRFGGQAPFLTWNENITHRQASASDTSNLAHLCTQFSCRLKERSYLSIPLLLICFCHLAENTANTKRRKIKFNIDFTKFLFNNVYLD